MRRLFMTICALVLGVATLPTAAEQTASEVNNWILELRSGEVLVRMGGANQEWQVPQTGTVLTAPFLIKTGETGQALLIREGDQLLISTDSVLEVTAVKRTTPGLVTRILQQLGTLLYRIETRPGRRFEVETPYLVSVVKGTTFSIHVTEQDATVSLTEGSLELVTPDALDRVLLKPGEIARRVRGIRAITVTESYSRTRQWGRWDAAANTMSRSDQGISSGETAATRIPAPARDRIRSDGTDSAPDRSQTIPGQSGTAPGLSDTLPGLSDTAPGPAHNKRERPRRHPGFSFSRPGPGAVPRFSNASSGRDNSSGFWSVRPPKGFRYKHFGTDHRPSGAATGRP